MASTEVTREFSRGSICFKLTIEPDDAPIVDHLDCCLAKGLQRYCDDMVEHLDWVGAKIIEPKEGWVVPSDSITINVVGVQVQLTVTIAFDGPVDPDFIAADVLAMAGPDFVAAIAERILKMRVGELLVSTGYGAKADEVSDEDSDEVPEELAELIGGIFGKLGGVEVVSMGDVAGIPAFAVRFDGDDEPGGPAFQASRN